MVQVIAEDSDYEEIHETILDYLGIDFTIEQVKQLVENESWLLPEMASHGLDTCVRESLLEAIGERMNQEAFNWKWSSGEQKDWWSKVKENAEQYGYKVINDAK